MKGGNNKVDLRDRCRLQECDRRGKSINLLLWIVCEYLQSSRRNICDICAKRSAHLHLPFSKSTCCLSFLDPTAAVAWWRRVYRRHCNIQLVRPTKAHCRQKFRSATNKSFSLLYSTTCDGQRTFSSHQMTVSRVRIVLANHRCLLAWESVWRTLDLVETLVIRSI